MTYSQIGNYGVNPEDIESNIPNVEGFIAKEFFDFPSNWRSSKGLNTYLKEHNKTGIYGIDTRALTSHLRDKGVQMGIVSTIDLDPHNLLKNIRKHPGISSLEKHPGISSLDLVQEVTTKKVYRWTNPLWKLEPEKVDVTKQDTETGEQKSERKSVVVYDFGVKMNILRHLVETGFDVTVVPAQTPPDEIIEKTDGIVLSNGPGDPQSVPYAIEITKKLLGKKPILGICLGHQILGLALGGSVTTEGITRSWI
jgi:carbamoyl-phosphate synthase small subunit